MKSLSNIHPKRNMDRAWMDKGGPQTSQDITWLTESPDIPQVKFTYSLKKEKTFMAQFHQF